MSAVDKAELRRRGAIRDDHAQMLDAQSQCAPCKLCGAQAVITDAGEGWGYSIACANSGEHLRKAKCTQAGIRLSGWAFNVSDLWNALNTHAHPAPAMEAEPVAWTGNGSLLALQDGREGFIFPATAEAHPIPLYAHPQDAESLRGEVERLRAVEEFTISDGGRLLRKSDVVGVCDDPDLCFERADDVARCGPCARKIAAASGIEMRVGECVPQVLKLTRQLRDMTAERDAARARVAEVEAELPKQYEMGRLAGGMVAALTPQPDAGLDAVKTALECLRRIRGLHGQSEVLVSEAKDQLETALRSRPVGEVALRPMADAPKDRTPILARIREDLAEFAPHYGLSGPEIYAGRFVVVSHPGLAADGFNIGWSLHGPFGHGLGSDAYFDGWLSLPRIRAALTEGEA